MKIESTVLGLLMLFAAPSWAEERAPTAESVPDPALTAAADGSFLQQVLPARVGVVQAFAFGSGGYDAARRGPLIDSAAEVRIWGPIALRAASTYSNDTARMRPSVGARVQLARQEAQGVDGSLSVFFKTEGFTEAEGEIESFASLGRRFDKLYVLTNLVYGQDPEGNERDGEVRAAAFRTAGRWVFGLDSRVRFAIGTQRGRAATSEPKFDVAGGPIVTVAAGAFALFAEAGPTAFKLATMGTRVGGAALAGLGAAF